MECREEMALGSLAVHMQMQHGNEAVGRRHWETTAPSGDSRTYRMAFTTTGGTRNCPVKGCPVRAATSKAMQINFFPWNIRDTILILEEGNPPHTRCTQCDILLPWSTLNWRHLSTAQCTRGEERKIIRLAEEDLQESLERAFQAYG